MIQQTHDRMFEILYYIYLLPLFLGAIVSLRSFRLNWPLPYKYFSFFLLSVLTIELFATAWKYFLHNTPWWHYSVYNIWIYNCFLIPQYLFYLFFFYLVLKSKVTRKIILLLVIFYTIFSIVNIFFVQTPHAVKINVIIAGDIIVIYLTISFFIQLLKDPELINLVYEPLVWISIGAFIFHLGNLPYFMFINTLNRINLSLSLSLFKIVLILNTLMYSFFTISFLCKPNYLKSR